ncbi:MAG: hypothetical protein ACI8ZM_005136 [Crocinitomix sp.]|jgi:hypothetical protein
MYIFDSKLHTMKRLLLLIGCALTATSFGQTQLENPGFEGTWENVTGSEDEPAEWSSLKTADALGILAPIVMFQSEDAHSGTYSVHLVNDVTAGIVANGVMTNGQVHADFDPENGFVFTNTDDSDWNTPFTDRPDSLVAWIKYNPVAEDHGKLELLLHDDSDGGVLPESGTTTHWVGKARYDIETSIGSWTRVSVPFIYYNESNPTHALMVVSSGDSTVAIEGSEMWIDDIELIYNPPMSVEMEEIDHQVYNSSNGLTVHITDYTNTQFKLLSIDGRVIYETTLDGTQTRHQIEEKGVFVYQITQNDQTVSKKIVLE